MGTLKENTVFYYLNSALLGAEIRAERVTCCPRWLFDSEKMFKYLIPANFKGVVPEVFGVSSEVLGFR